MFRVAWRAHAVLQGFSLKIIDAAAWPAATGQLVSLLHGFGRHNAALIRDLTIEGLAREPRRLTARTAELDRYSVLVLRDAALDDEHHAEIRLALSGPAAGTLAFTPPAAPHQSSSPPPATLP